MTCIEHNQAGEYGLTSIKVGDKWRSVGMHRVAYCTANNVSLASIKGKVVRHKCDNPRCINPEHLELGSHKDNAGDRVDRNRGATGDAIYRTRSTTKLTPDDVEYIRQSPLTGKELAKRFGVSNGTISMARRGLTHK